MTQLIVVLLDADEAPPGDGTIANAAGGRAIVDGAGNWAVADGAPIGAVR